MYPAASIADPTDRSRIRVGIVDDQLLFRKGLAAILKSFSDLQLLLEASDGQHLVDQLAPPSEREIDVILLDLEMPRLDGVGALRWLRHHRPDVRVIILSMHGEESLIMNLVDEGVDGYLFKNAEPEEVAQAIRQVWPSGSYFTPDVREMIQDQLLSRARNRRAATEMGPGVLTLAEHDVLTLVIKGLTSAEIGARLALSPRTVEGRRQRLLAKLGVRSVAEMIHVAIQQKLV